MLHAVQFNAVSLLARCFAAGYHLLCHARLETVCVPKTKKKTASLARERPLPAHLVQQGVPSPKPLRSPEWIWGLPHLTGLNKAKVETANRLYRFTAKLMLWCLQLGCLISIENLWGSYFWACLVDCVRTLGTAACNLYNTLEHVVFSSCLHGGSRQKSTKWLSSPGTFSSLAGDCPGESSTHKHLPYGVHRKNKQWHFDTASEGAYPDLLCLRVVHCVASALGFSPVPPAPTVADPNRSKPQTLTPLQVINILGILCCKDRCRHLRHTEGVSGHGTKPCASA